MREGTVTAIVVAALVAVVIVLAIISSNAKVDRCMRAFPEYTREQCKVITVR